MGRNIDCAQIGQQLCIRFRIEAAPIAGPRAGVGDRDVQSKAEVIIQRGDIIGQSSSRI